MNSCWWEGDTHNDPVSHSFCLTQIHSSYNHNPALVCRSCPSRSDSQFCYFAESVSECVLQYPGIGRLRVWHGGDRDGLHRTLQRAEVVRFHLDARPRGEGAQTQVSVPHASIGFLLTVILLIHRRDQTSVYALVSFELYFASISSLLLV